MHLLALSAAVLALAAIPAALQPGTVSTAKNEYNYTVARDGRTAVFARSEAEFQQARILVMVNGRAPELIHFHDARWSDTDPQIAADGASLLFVSNRPLPDAPGRSDLNIWRSERRDGRWDAPVPVSGVNGAGVELGPEIHAGVLTFNSARRAGLGGLDIYAAPVDGSAAPAPLPAPLNSKANEGDFTVSPDGKVALFWSDRPGGQGAGDIWMSRRSGAGWAEPVNLGPRVNSAGFDFTPSFSPDGRTLYFASTRGDAHGTADIYALPIARIPVLAAALRP